MPRLPKMLHLDNRVHSVTTLMESVYCDECGVQFCVPLELMRIRVDAEEAVYCPNGHENVYVNADELADADNQSDRLKHENMKLRHLLDQTEAKLRDQRAAGTESKDARTQPDTQVTDDDAVLPCPYCDRKLKNKRGLTYHVRKAHGDEPGCW